MKRPEKDRGRPGQRRQTSVSSKYSMGYFLMLLIVVTIFLVSVLSVGVLSSRYQAMLDELLELNELFVNVEAVNMTVTNYYLFLRATSRDAFHTDSAVTQESLNVIFRRLEQSYSRDVMDLCRMVETYLAQTNDLVRMLDQYGAVGGTDTNAALEAAYTRTQDTMSYINQSFKDIYTVLLDSARQVQQEMLQMRNAVNALQVIMLGLAVGTCIAYYRQVLDGITRSLRRLTDFAHSVAENPIGQEHVSIDTADEFAVFANAFNEMLDTIEGQITQIGEASRVREQLQLAEMENLRISSALQSSQLRLLQSRINPHFLFNTLNMISQTAHMEDAEETAGLIEATASFLRYNLGKITKTVTLQDELENTQNYVWIQQCRFGQRIEFRFEVDPACQPQHIPCMILQPIVENSVQHGVSPLIGGGRVVIRLYTDSKRNYLEVEDNGVGIDEDTLQRILESFGQANGSDEHIGLKNVYQRLQLFFGEDPQFQFEIISKPGHTLVRIGLPREEE